jgi:hypothetical protein
MGFGIGNPFKKVKSLFSGAKRLTGGVGDFLDVTQPGSIGDLLTFGSISQSEAVKQSKGARNDAKRQYADQTAAAQAEAQRIANLEEERKRKLLLYGTQKPSTMIGGYLGIGGTANVSRPGLG